MPEPRRKGAYAPGSVERWERRLLRYARFCAESALSADFLRELTRMVHADFPFVVATLSYREDGSLAETYFSDLLPSLQLDYRDHYHFLNPFREAVETHGLSNQLVVFDRYVARRELLKTEYYNDFMRRAKMDYLAALSVQTGAVARTSISIYRSEAAGGSFEGDDARRLEQLWPFFRSALLLRAYAQNRKVPAPDCVSGGDLIHLADRRSITTAAGGSPVGPGERFGLSARELEVALAIREGLTYKEVADHLGIAFNTVATHVKSCRRKMNARSLAHMAKLLDAFDR